MKKYGIIGFPLSHSFSYQYFTQKFIAEGLNDCCFENYTLEDISKVREVLSDKALQGFCITIPHKKNILPFLTAKTEAVTKIQACNCVNIIGDKWVGHNTDVIGFEQSFTPHLQKHHRSALILGTGGAALAVEYVLQKMGIAFKYVSRKPLAHQLGYDEIDAAVLAHYSIIINASPVGTYPNVDEAPLLPYDKISAQHYLFDLVYNPPLTKFLALGKHQGAIIQNGYPMLTIQAEENWKIWNNKKELL